MASKRKVADGLFQFGAGVRVERGVGQEADAPRCWFVYRRTDVADDPDTSENERWDEAGRFVETEVGEMPAAAAARAQALADKGE